MGRDLTATGSATVTSGQRPQAGPLALPLLVTVPRATVSGTGTDCLRQSLSSTPASRCQGVTASLPVALAQVGLARGPALAPQLPLGLP